MKRFVASIVLAAMAASFSIGAHAELSISTDPADLAAFDRAYAKMMSNPADLDGTLDYAELAAELGDYEAAIPPLERILLSNPDIPKIKLELGILYYLLGSKDVSRIYFQQVKQSAKASPEMVGTADEYLMKL